MGKCIDNLSEEWRTIPDFDNYEVSNKGKVRSVNYNRKGYVSELKPFLSGSGYKQVTLCKKGKKYRFEVHRLVAQTFIENPNNYAVVNHRDENKLNNDVTNLEWCTMAYNNQYSRGAKVIQQDLEGNLIAQYNSYYEACCATGISMYMLQQCCWGKRDNYNGCVWNLVDDSIICQATKKKISVYDIEGNFIKTLDNAVIAGKATGVTVPAILWMCNGNKTRSKYKFRFKFYGE